MLEATSFGLHITGSGSLVAALLLNYFGGPEIEHTIITLLLSSCSYHFRRVTSPFHLAESQAKSYPSPTAVNILAKMNEVLIS